MPKSEGDEGGEQPCQPFELLMPSSPLKNMIELIEEKSVNNLKALLLIIYRL